MQARKNESALMFKEGDADDDANIRYLWSQEVFINVKNALTVTPEKVV